MRLFKTASRRFFISPHTLLSAKIISSRLFLATISRKRHSTHFNIATRLSHHILPQAMDPRSSSSSIMITTTSRAASTSPRSTVLSSQNTMPQSKQVPRSPSSMAFIAIISATISVMAVCILTHINHHPYSKSKFSQIRTFHSPPQRHSSSDFSALFTPPPYQFQSSPSVALQPSSLDIIFGNLLVVVGYLLTLGVGITLMRRARAHAHNRRLVLSATTNLDGAYSDTLPETPTGGNGLNALVRSSRRARSVEACTQIITWSDEKLDATHYVDSDSDDDHSQPLSTNEYKTLVHSKQCTQCAVCLSDLSDGDRARILPCKHAFHCVCADLWLVQSDKNFCPLCMQTVTP